MSAVFGPKSLYSGLAIWSLLPLELQEASIIQDTSTTYPAMSSQSAMVDPWGRTRYKLDRLRLTPSEALLKIFGFHLGQHSNPIAVTKNVRSPHKRGREVQKKASATR